MSNPPQPSDPNIKPLDLSMDEHEEPPRDWRRRLRDLWRAARPPYTGGSSDRVFGFDVYGEHHEKRWFKLTILPFHRHVLGNIDKAWRFQHYRLFNRMHVVRTGIKPGWHDVDEVMFHACFRLLGRFVETELGKIGPKDPSYGRCSSYRGYRLHSGDEAAIDLWLWYLEELPEIVRLYDEDVMRCYGGGGRTLFDPSGIRESVPDMRPDPKYDHDWPETVKDEKLRELIDMRRSLWT